MIGYCSGHGPAPESDGLCHQCHLLIPKCPACAAMKGRMTVEGVAKVIHKGDRDADCFTLYEESGYSKNSYMKIARAVIEYLEGK